MNCRYGTNRVIEPSGVLPQTALKISNDMNINSNEILIDVKTLNIDSASFTQLKEVNNNDKSKIENMILDIVNTRGKMQNPVTGSGGMLIGIVEKIGEDFPDKNLKVGDKIATLVSLSLTPLKINKINNINLDNDQVDVDAKAILFESGLYAKIPTDIDEKLALAALDVAGAPAQTKKLVKKGDTVFIIGSGKSGILCSYIAKKYVGEEGKVIVMNRTNNGLDFLEENKYVDNTFVGDAKNAVDVYKKIYEITDGKLCDVVINNVNVENTEMASILSCKDDGVVYFFSMATSFTKAALGAEGVGSDVTMIVGNGYTKNHADLTLDILRESEPINKLFSKLYI